MFSMTSRVTRGSAAAALRRRTATTAAVSSAVAAIAVAARAQRLRYSSYQPPNAPKQAAAPSNAHRAFYRDFGAPVAKVFLGALVTYQVLYWCWLKLESLDIKDEKNGEIAALEAQVRALDVKIGGLEAKAGSK